MSARNIDRRELFISPYLDRSTSLIDQCIRMIDETDASEEALAIAFYKRKNLYSKLRSLNEIEILRIKHCEKFGEKEFSKWIESETLFFNVKAKIHDNAMELAGDPFEFNDTILLLVNEIYGLHGTLDVSNSAKAEVLKKLVGVFFKHHTNGSCKIPNPQFRSSVNPKFGDHIQLLIEYDNISELEDCWRYFDYELTRNSPNECSILPFYNDDYLFKILRRVSNIAINDWASRIKLETEDFSFTLTDKLAPHAYLNIYEKVSYSALKNYVFDVSKDISGFKIPECIRAYATIQFISATHEDEIFLISKESLKKELLRFGIPYKSISRIISLLQFTSKTTDMCHSPLLDSDDNFLIIRNIASEINPAQSFLGALKDKEIDVSARGKLFEKKIESRFKPRKTKSNIKDKFEGEQYECDICIQFESTVFIECKTHHFPWSTRELYKHCFKIFSDLKKSIRTFSHFKTNIDRFEKRHKFAIGENPLYILVTNTPFGGIHNFNGIYLTDSSSLERFLCRIPPAITDMGTQTDVSIPQYTQLYSGVLTFEKMKIFLEANPTIREVTCTLNDAQFDAAEMTWNTKRHSFNENMIFIPAT